MLLTKKTKKQAAASKDSRILISVTVIGSPGPIRLVVNQEELVAAVIDLILKSYARAGRIPILGTNIEKFFLYRPASGAEGQRRRPAATSSGVNRKINYAVDASSFSDEFES
ncbi:Senescence-associated protein [Heracleum sosnowskyi]|uniref:Senescence-associated protein n=1 Tax=Heracleum sosnowskyi TaxID=360622 RepID=A0AAD8IAU6_9APIA|nr:Senescence-associated protein [Heracleum sosnowskyi]